MYTYICIKKYIVLLKKIEGNKCDEIKFEITELFSSFKASPSLWICFEIIWFENVCILEEAILCFFHPFPKILLCVRLQTLPVKNLLSIFFSHSR